MRSTRRTDQTGSALMDGLAQVDAMSVFGDSLSKSGTDRGNDAVRADILVTTGNGAGNFSKAVVAKAAAVPGVTQTTTIYGGQFEIRNTLASLIAVSTQHLTDTVILRMASGSSAALDQGDLLLD